MQVLLCNLDPAWDFNTLVHNHCLDLYQDDRFHLWNINASPKAEPWGNWPRHVDRLYLASEIAKAYSQVPSNEDILLVFNLPSLETEALKKEIAEILKVQSQPIPTEDSNTTGCHTGRYPKPGLVAMVHQELQRQQRLKHSQFILTLSQDSGGTKELNALCQGPLVDHIVLLDKEPRRRLYGLRMLVSLFRDQGLGATLSELANTAVVTLHLECRQGATLYDSVMERWPAIAEKLLCACQLFRTSSGEETGLQPWKMEVEAALQDIAKLRYATPPLDTVPNDEAIQLLQLPAPWFFSPTLPFLMQDHVERFIRILDRHLEQRCRELKRQHHKQHKQHKIREAELQKRLQSHRMLTPGGNEHTIAVLEHQAKTIEGMQHDIGAEEQRLLGLIRGNLKLETRRGAQLYGGENCSYRRTLFQEDEALQAALSQTRQAATKLTPRQGLWVGLATMTLLALLPIIALRGPSWLSKDGFGNYLQDFSLGLMDLFWVGVFVLSYLGFGLYQAHRRRRGLVLAQEVLEQQAYALWQCNVDALRYTLRYQDHALAMGRLVALDEHCARLLAQAHQAREALSILHGTLTRQRQYYRTLGDTAVSARPDLDLSALLQHSPHDWLYLALQSWRGSRSEKIDFKDDRQPRPGQLETDYLRNCTLIRIRRADF